MKLPLFANVPLLILRSPDVQIAAPSFCNTRCRLWAVLFMTSVPVLAMIVRPLPLIPPPDHVIAPVTVTSPDPVSVPLFRVRPVTVLPFVTVTVKPPIVTASAAPGI